MGAAEAEGKNQMTEMTTSQRADMAWRVKFNLQVMLGLVEKVMERDKKRGNRLCKEVQNHGAEALRILNCLFDMTDDEDEEIVDV